MGWFGFNLERANVGDGKERERLKSQTWIERRVPSWWKIMSLLFSSNTIMGVGLA